MSSRSLSRKSYGPVRRRDNTDYNSFIENVDIRKRRDKEGYAMNEGSYHKPSGANEGEEVVMPEIRIESLPLDVSYG